MNPFDPKAIEAACDTFTPGVRYELTAFTAGIKYARRHDAQARTPTADADDRQMLLTVMQELDNSVWNCERCGHAEDTKTMDVAYMLRRHLASAQSPAPALGKAERYTPYWQGGLTNAELAQWWRLKTKAEPTDRDMSCFALGVEVGCGTNPAPKPEGLGQKVPSPAPVARSE